MGALSNLLLVQTMDALSTLIDTFSPQLTLLDNKQQEMIAQTIQLASINSGSFNAAGVNSVLEAIIELAKPLDAEHQRIAVAPFKEINDNGSENQRLLGDALQFQKRPDAPLQLFLCAHMDTVFAKDSPFQQVQWLNDHTLNGPGVTDLKGGIVVMLQALAVLEQSPWAEQIGWTILLNPDEEIGSISSAPLIEAAAKQAHIGMIFEPCFPSGDLAGQRKGSGNFAVVAQGQAAHAGREHHLGRNAIRALCDFISAMDDLNGQRKGVTFNPAYIHGGGATNVVPDLCMHKFNIRLEQPEDQQWCTESLNKIIADINQRDGIRLTLHGGFTRQPKIISPANQALLDFAIEIGSCLSLQLQVKPTGGCCDGNNLAALGIANIDTLGVQGGAIHSEEEYLDLRSLIPRAKLSAALMLTLAYLQAEGKLPTWVRG